MTDVADHPPDHSQTLRLEPVWRAFVLRPALIASLPAGLVGAASFFFWQPLQWTLGRYAVAVPALATVAVLATFFSRWIRHAKTNYEIHPDRITVQTGSLFRERTVELELQNITLVEWDSPFVLRFFYDAGHVTLQEAGSSEKPAHLACIANPGRVYERIAERMSARGFSMRRNELVQEETPGHLGATVDLVALQVKLFWIVALLVLQSLPESLTLLVGDGPSLVQLVAGNYAVFSELAEPAVFTRIRIGTILVGGSTLLLFAGWLVTLYLDLLHRTYTLYDDVIDYVDGFLNETRRFIPLENLADTRVARPFYKRFLGLSDVTLSSQGAENDIVFKSTPNGRSFAESVERLVERAPSPTPSELTAASSEPAPAEADLSLKPSLIRAALGGIGSIPIYLLIAGSMIASLSLEGDPTLEFGPLIGVGIAGLIVAGVLLSLVAGAAGAAWSMIRASATTFGFDRRGAHQTFDLISKHEQRFASERITSVTIVRTPLDWLAGTATVRFRSIGSEKSIDFWGIPDRPKTLRTIRDALGVRAPADPDEARHTDDLTPAYTLYDGIWAFGPLYAPCAAAVVLGTVLASSADVPYGPQLSAVVAATLLSAAILHQLLRSIFHGRMRGTLHEQFVEVEGGILRRYTHLAPVEHVKAVESLRYPGSEAGRLTFKTAGFPIAVGHLPDVEDAHEFVDARLGHDRNRLRGSYVSLEPGAWTQGLRWSWTLLLGVGFVVVPYVVAYYLRMDYTVGPGRLVADGGVYFDYRTTILHGRIDHIESNRILAHWLSDTYDIRVFTVGSATCDLVFRSVGRETEALELIRQRLPRGDVR